VNSMAKSRMVSRWNMAADNWRLLLVGKLQSLVAVNDVEIFSLAFDVMCTNSLYRDPILDVYSTTANPVDRV
jgi:hypothetical protein